MGRASSGKKHRQEVVSTIDKGKVVEQVVAKLYQGDYPGATVRHNVQLSAKRNPKRKRQIDVLLTTNVAGVPINIAIECKNEKRSIDVEAIESFLAKLDYLGIPRQHGIFVSASGYTSGAIERASEDGMQTLTLLGLSSDRLSSAIVQAYQSIVYVLPDITEMTVSNLIDHAEKSYEMIVFRDNEGHVCGSVPDLIWQKWVSGQIPTTLGEHCVELSLPKHWHCIVDGKEESIVALTAKVQVNGLIITLHGRANKHTLLNAIDRVLQKKQITAKFEAPTEGEVMPIITVTSELELRTVTAHSNSINLTIGRFRLPRMRLGAAYYPHSERVAMIMINKMQAFEAGQIPDPRPFKFEELEGTDLSTVWEPIWPEHPAIKKGDRINWINE